MACLLCNINVKSLFVSACFASLLLSYFALQSMPQVCVSQTTTTDKTCNHLHHSSILSFCPPPPPFARTTNARTHSSHQQLFSPLKKSMAKIFGFATRTLSDVPAIQRHAHGEHCIVFDIFVGHIYIDMDATVSISINNEFLHTQQLLQIFFLNCVSEDGRIIPFFFPKKLIRCFVST